MSPPPSLLTTNRAFSLFSRQYGFLKLSAPENLKKKALVLKVRGATPSLTLTSGCFPKQTLMVLRPCPPLLFPQAVKYLERMLIQAYNQKKKAHNEEDKAKEKEAGSVVAEGVKIKQEADNPLCDVGVTIDESLPAEIMSTEGSGDAKQPSTPVNEIKTEDGGDAGGSKEDGSEREEEGPATELDKQTGDGDRDISIDPKTYCKLGHFHLLLEDYEKGTGKLMAIGIAFF